ncbi:unnamed protein product [Camellia sinensis]
MGVYDTQKEKMNNLVLDQSFYIESEDEDQENEFNKGEDDGNDSDSSNYSNENWQQSKTGSLNTTTWPQSYSFQPSESKPLLSTPEDEQQPKQKRSLHSLLPPVPSRKSSVRKSVKISHELPVSQQSSYSQAVLNDWRIEKNEKNYLAYQNCIGDFYCGYGYFHAFLWSGDGTAWIFTYDASSKP